MLGYRVVQVSIPQYFGSFLHCIGSAKWSIFLATDLETLLLLKAPTGREQFLYLGGKFQAVLKMV